MDETAHLIIRVDSDEVESAGKNLDTFTGKAGKTERATDGLVSAFKRLITVAAALAAVKKSFDVIGGFEEGMSGVRAVTQATDEDFQKLTATARQLGADTRYSAREAADGMQFLAQAGFNTEQIIAAMPGTLDLATAGALDLAAAADIASNILSGFNLKAEQSARIADVLAAAAAGSNTDVLQLGDAMKYVAPIAASLGLTVEDTAAAIGILSNAGLQGSMAGTGLRQVLSSLASPTAEAADILRAYGLQLDEVNPATNSLTVVIERLSKAGLTAGDALQIFGDRGAPAILALTNQTESLAKLNKTIETSQGAAKEMARVMGDNLRGDVKNLTSAIEELVLSAGDAGLLKIFREGAQGATDFVRSINDMVASGEVGAWVDLIYSKLSLLTDGFSNAAANIAEIFGATFDFLRTDAKEVVDVISDAFFNLPENVRAAAQGVGATFGVLWEYLKSIAEGVGRYFIAEFKYVWDNARILAKQIQETLKGNADDWDWDRSYSEASKRRIRDIGQSWVDLGKGIDNATAAYEKTVTEIMDERDANIASSDAKLKKIDELRAAYAKLKADRAAAEAAPKTTTAVGSKPAEDVAGRFQTREFDQLRQQLQLEEKTVQESYDRRLELIRKNTKEGSSLRADLESQLNDRFDIEMEAAHMTRASRLEAQYNAEQNLLQTALDSRLISEEVFQEKSRANWEKYTKGVTSISTGGARVVATKQLEMYATVLGFAGDIAGQMQGLVEGNNRAAKAMFIAAKAISIAQAIVYTELAATRALAEGGMIAGIPMSTAIRALGYASVALMGATAVQEYAGKFEHGGMIPSGKVGMVREAGFELLRGPAVVTSARATADLAGAEKPQSNVQVNVINQAGAEVETSERETQDGRVIDVMIKRVASEIANGIRTGGNPVSAAIQQTFNLRRGTT